MSFDYDPCSPTLGLNLKGAFVRVVQKKKEPLKSQWLKTKTKRQEKFVSYSHEYL